MKKWSRYAELVLALALLGVVVDVGWLVSRGQHFAPPSTTVVLPPITAAPAVEPISSSLVSSLFGDPPPPTVAAPESGQPATTATPAVQREIPDPAAQMTLIGTIVSPGQSIALVMLSGKERMVSEGATLGDFTVAAIHDDEVVLALDGQQRTLHLPSFQPPVAKTPTLRPTATPSNHPRQQADGRLIVSSRDREAAFAHPEELLKTFRILPNTRNGAPYGARIVYLQPASLLAAFGLAQDDILLYVDGKPVSTENAPELMKAFQLADTLVIKLERNSHPLQLTIEFR